MPPSAGPLPAAHPTGSMAAPIAPPPASDSVSNPKMELTQNLDIRGPAPPMPPWVLPSLHTLAQQRPRDHFGVHL